MIEDDDTIMIIGIELTHMDLIMVLFNVLFVLIICILSKITPISRKILIPSNLLDSNHEEAPSKLYTIKFDSKQTKKKKAVTKDKCILTCNECGEAFVIRKDGLKANE